MLFRSVPSSSPSTTLVNAPALNMLNTQIGSFWSRHSVSAVASITLSFFPAAINIGPNPTFGEAINKVEVHLIHFASDLYGQHLELELFEKLRSIHAFASKDELIEQLKVDSKRAQQIAESV